jgi:hypothetical protein
MSKNALQKILRGFSALIPPRSHKSHQPVRSMPLQFRVALNKRPPSEPSFVVVGGPRPVRACFGEESGTGASSKEELMQSFAEEVVVQKYIIYVTAMRRVAEATQEGKK